MNKNEKLFVARLLGEIVADLCQYNGRSVHVEYVKQIAKQSGVNEIKIDYLKGLLVESDAVLEVLDGIAYDEILETTFDDEVDENYITISIGDLFICENLEAFEVEAMYEEDEEIEEWIPLHFASFIELKEYFNQQGVSGLSLALSYPFKDSLIEWHVLIALCTDIFGMTI